MTRREIVLLVAGCVAGVAALFGIGWLVANAGRPPRDVVAAGYTFTLPRGWSMAVTTGGGVSLLWFEHGRLTDNAIDCTATILANGRAPEEVLADEARERPEGRPTPASLDTPLGHFSGFRFATSNAIGHGRSEDVYAKRDGARAVELVSRERGFSIWRRGARAKCLAILTTIRKAKR